MQDRVYALEGIANFRDFGDYPTEDGGRVARGAVVSLRPSCHAYARGSREIERPGDKPGGGPASQL